MNEDKGTESVPKKTHARTYSSCMSGWAAGAGCALSLPADGCVWGCEHN